MNKKLPKTIYVTWDQPPNDDGAYLLAAEKWEEHAGMGQRKVVGTYQLVEVNDVEGKPTIVKPKRSRS